MDRLTGMENNLNHLQFSWFFNLIALNIATGSGHIQTIELKKMRRKKRKA